MAELDAQDLFDLLEVIDEELSKAIQLVAAGGTALTLQNLKASTRDIDFTGPEESIRAFKAAQAKVKHGYRIDTWTDGWVFSTSLPKDYLDHAIHIRTIGHIELYALCPLDVVITKVDRFDDRDQMDIWTAIDETGIRAEEVEERAKATEWVGQEHNVRYTVDRLLAMMRGERRRDEVEE